MDALVNDSINYSGEVNFSLRIGDRVVNKKIHNEGTMQLKRAFAMFMCGGRIAEDALRYIPSKLDLRQDGVTFLKRPVAVTNPAYDIDESGREHSWYVEYSAVIPYSSLLSNIDSTKNYRIYLMCDTIASSDVNHDIAVIEIPGVDLVGVQAGVSAIITWRLKLLNEPAE